MIKSAGTESCGTYLSDRATNDDVHGEIYVSWVWGYMAGFNMEVRQPTSQRLPDQPSTLAYLDKHCRDNPLDSVLLATAALARDQGGRRNPR